MVPTRILKEFADTLSPMLTAIFQQSLDTGEVPNDWKEANISAIYKKSSKQDPANYRPVSLTSVCCKTLEHILYSNIMNHLDSHGILVHFQHGFREKRSTESQLIQTIDDILKNADERGHTDILILDFSKAFDTVPHARLMKKLQHYGINDKTHRWLRNWLTGRKQRVVVEGEESRTEQVKSGVPQGTVLGPLMFLVYINDIADNIQHSTVRLFADDCLLYRNIKSIEDTIKLQDDLTAMENWAKKWQMIFNPTKCYHLRSTRQKKPIKSHYKMLCHQLEEVEHHPYLGVEFSNDYSWSHHIDKVTGKAEKSLNFLRRNLGKCSRETKNLAVTTMVRPILEYASAAWDPYQQNHINQVERIQSKAARFATGRYNRRDSVTEMRKDLGWLTLQERRFITRMSIFYKIVYSQIAIKLPSYTHHELRFTRSANPKQYYMPTTCTDVFRFSYFPRTIRCWNILPSQLTSVSSVDVFKDCLCKEVKNGNIYLVPPKGTSARPRLGSTGNMPGAVY
jgi:hypothetical protein